MNANTNIAGVMMNAGPLFGVTGCIAALAAAPNPEARFFYLRGDARVAASSAMRKYLFASPAKAEIADYPFDTRTANPWERDNGPAGL